MFDGQCLAGASFRRGAQRVRVGRTVVRGPVGRSAAESGVDPGEPGGRILVAQPDGPTRTPFSLSGLRSRVGLAVRAGR